MNAAPGVLHRSLVPTAQVAELAELLRGRRIVVLTGAGCSTESGIPDYRGPGTQQRARNPIQYRAFISKPSERARYWARSVIGWSRFSAAAPNPAHHALAMLERAGLLAGIITQNVDRLHHAAGSRRVVELHGALAEVSCLACGAIEARDDLQARLLRLNPDWPDWPDWPRLSAEMAPDGDAELPAELAARFRIADCVICGGTLKPNVVFFGENVPRHVVDAAWQLFDEADLLLVVGSSLTVFSGYRFVRRAGERGIPVGMINLGPTRGDSLAALRLDAPCGTVLPALADMLLSVAGDA